MVKHCVDTLFAVFNGDVIVLDEVFDKSTMQRHLPSVEIGIC